MRPLKITGQVSYGLYAYHLPVFFFFGATYMQMEEPIISPALASLLVGVTAVITLTSWYLMEKPLLDKKAVIIGMIDAHVRSVDKSGVGLSQHDIAGKARDRHKRKG